MHRLEHRKRQQDQLLIVPAATTTTTTSSYATCGPTETTKTVSFVDPEEKRRQRKSVLPTVAALLVGVWMTVLVILFSFQVNLGTTTQQKHASSSILQLAVNATNTVCPSRKAQYQVKSHEDDFPFPSTPTLFVQERTGKIPHVIHQTSKTTCLTHYFFNATQQWIARFPRFRYYFHDDTALMRLLRSSTQKDDFPELRETLPCLMNHGAMKADVWRYVLLYQYGGIYADLDTAPSALFNESTFSSSLVKQDEDALFVVEQFHMLSQWFMAVKPKHPLMKLAVQHSLENLRQVPDTGKASAALITGPHALHQAFISFCRDGGITIGPAGAGRKPVQAGLYRGTNGTTVRVVGKAENQNQYVIRDVIGNRKRREYEKMGMVHFKDSKQNPSSISCAAAIKSSDSI